MIDTVGVGCLQGAGVDAEAEGTAGMYRGGSRRGNADRPSPDTFSSPRLSVIYVHRSAVPGQDTHRAWKNLYHRDPLNPLKEAAKRWLSM